MAIVRWTPANDLAGLHSAMDRLFGDVFGDAAYGAPGGAERTEGGSKTGRLPTYHLPVNISETKEGYRIEAPVPGFQPEEVEVMFADGMLTIDASRREERKEDEGSFMRREVAFGNYRRQISLPGDVRGDDIKAGFDNGILTVLVPQARKPQPKRIQIQAGQSAKQLVGAGKR